MLKIDQIYPKLFPYLYFYHTYLITERVCAIGPCLTPRLDLYPVVNKQTVTHVFSNSLSNNH